VLSGSTGKYRAVMKGRQPTWIGLPQIRSHRVFHEGSGKAELPVKTHVIGRVPAIFGSEDCFRLKLNAQSHGLVTSYGHECFLQGNQN